MFERIIYEHSAAAFTIAAFAVALVLFLALSWRAIRMKPRQVERFERLPFE